MMSGNRGCDSDRSVTIRGYSVADMGNYYYIADLPVILRNEYLSQPAEPWRNDQDAESACSYS